MSTHAELPDRRQFTGRTSLEVRSTLLALTREFVRAARQIDGVDRIALLGSLLTEKPNPKDTDVLVSIGDHVDLGELARVGRRLKGTAQSRAGAGADIFLASARGEYLGRACHYRECHRRVLCYARNCGARLHVADDFDVVHLAPALIAAPPVQLYPAVVAHGEIPADVEFLLLAPLDRDYSASAEPPGSDAPAI